MYNNIINTIFRTIFLGLFIFELYKTLTSKDRRAIFARRYFMDKFRYYWFWVYMIIFILLTLFVHNSYIEKILHPKTLYTLRQSVFLGWGVFIGSIFAGAGFTIALAVLISFLYLFFNVDFA